eukprot:Gregarina_sp_Poly_1__1648@NODE_141_length_12988_cov_478_019271_g126_i0_p5_GENE_NODE_141_length_12988_cov_478_019271_g126_i0NODE_141_length_12988_cov_478_019271_g126_i0_p5_ORF_typecomplete_len421_score46_15EFhand_2/PF09068_11/2_6EFhand_2/PF09068_11/1_7e02RhoGEF/PF00621_20/0_82_NODE_141_length_12988_cov_478_019271_g126_i0461308
MFQVLSEWLKHFLGPLDFVKYISSAQALIDMYLLLLDQESLVSDLSSKYPAVHSDLISFKSSLIEFLEMLLLGVECSPWFQLFSSTCSSNNWESLDASENLLLGHYEKTCLRYGWPAEYLKRLHKKDSELIILAQISIRRFTLALTLIMSYQKLCKYRSLRDWVNFWLIVTWMWRFSSQFKKAQSNCIHKIIQFWTIQDCFKDHKLLGSTDLASGFETRLVMVNKFLQVLNDRGSQARKRWDELGRRLFPSEEAKKPRWELAHGTAKLDIVSVFEELKQKMKYRSSEEPIASDDLIMHSITDGFADGSERDLHLNFPGLEVLRPEDLGSKHKQDVLSESTGSVEHVSSLPQYASVASALTKIFEEAETRELFTEPRSREVVFTLPVPETVIRTKVHAELQAALAGANSECVKEVTHTKNL